MKRLFKNSAVFLLLIFFISLGTIISSILFIQEKNQKFKNPILGFLHNNLGFIYEEDWYNYIDFDEGDKYDYSVNVENYVTKPIVWENFILNDDSLNAQDYFYQFNKYIFSHLGNEGGFNEKNSFDEEENFSINNYNFYEFGDYHSILTFKFNDILEGGCQDIDTLDFFYNFQILDILNLRFLNFNNMFSNIENDEYDDFIINESNKVTVNKDSETKVEITIGKDQNKNLYLKTKMLSKEFSSEEPKKYLFKDGIKFNPFEILFFSFRFLDNENNLEDKYPNYKGVFLNHENTNIYWERKNGTLADDWEGFTPPPPNEFVFDPKAFKVDVDGELIAGLEKGGFSPIKFGNFITIDLLKFLNLNNVATFISDGIITLLDYLDIGTKIFFYVALDVVITIISLILLLLIWYLVYFFKFSKKTKENKK